MDFDTLDRTSRDRRRRETTERREFKSLEMNEFGNVSIVEQLGIGRLNKGSARSGAESKCKHTGRHEIRRHFEECKLGLKR